MLTEYAPSGRRGLISSLVSLGTNSGTLAASGLWAVLLATLSEDQMLAWGWRLPFLCSFLLLLFAVWLRTHLKESPVFEQRPDVVDGVALSRKELQADGGPGTEPGAAGAHTLEAGLRQRKGRAFFLALGLRFGQASTTRGSSRPSWSATSPPPSWWTAPYPPPPSSTAHCSASSPCRSSACSATASAMRPVYLALTALTMVVAVPLMYVIANGGTVALTIAVVLALNIGVLGLFSLESVTMAELFGSRTRFTQLAVAKEIGGILATAVGPVIAATLTAATHHWWPIAAMLVGYSLITLVSAWVAPETKGRDLVRWEDAA